MLYELTKLSTPGFTLTSNDLTPILRTLTDYICPTCKLTEAEVTAASTSYPSIEEFEQAIYDALPNNYSSLAPIDQVDYLLSTPCGAEFTLDKSE
jgi:hypothetical protein